MLVGRDTEIARLAALVEAVRHGRSSVVVLRGDPGIGKTALLDHVRDTFGAGTALATRSCESEADIPYVHLADLLRPVAGLLDQLPHQQAAALAGVLALGPPVSGDRYTVSAATLTVLGLLARDAPLLLLVDDVQWMDPFSLEVLCFVGRRLHADRTLMLIGLRAGETTPSGLDRFEHIVVDGIDDGAARELVAASGPQLDRATTVRLVAEAAGNPLALLELPRALRAAERTDHLAPLPVGELVAATFRASLERLPGDCRTALLVLAVLGAAELDLLDRALAPGGLHVGTFVPAERSGIVLVQHRRMTFRHPLIRSAVHHAADPASRRAAHLAAAQALRRSGSPQALERRAWHLVAGGSGPDVELATALEEAAAQEYARSNFATAANLFERSGQLSADAASTTTRLLAAADGYRLAGAIEASRTLLARAGETVEDPLLALVVQYYLGRIDLWRSGSGIGTDALVAIARRAEALDPALAARILDDAALACTEAGRLVLARELCERSETLAADERPLEQDVVSALAHALSGADAIARTVLRRRAHDIDSIDPLATDLVNQLGLVAAMAHLAIEESERADQVLVAAVSGARDASTVGVLPFRLGRLAWVRFWRGRWTSAVALGEEALLLAEDTGWLAERHNSLAVLARVAAATGRVDDCRRYSTQAVAVAHDAHLDVARGYANAAQGALALGEGEYELAVQLLGDVHEFAAANGLVDTPMLWWSADLIEALLAAGRRNEAVAHLAELDEGLAAHGPPTLRAVAARSHALTEPDEAEHHLRVALRWHDRGDMPFERARTELLLGTHLGAGGHEHTRSALAVLDRLGARQWAARGRAPARTRPDSASDPLFARLTPQELQVALQVAGGLSNREVAERLFLSVKTVEFHLGNVFHKLGVKRRAQLALVVARHEAPPTIGG